jgi:hypothetical protein
MTAEGTTGPSSTYGASRVDLDDWRCIGLWTFTFSSRHCFGISLFLADGRDVRFTLR